MDKCLLPYSDCVYKRKQINCDDLVTSPFNSDACCFRLVNKKKMIRQASLDTSKICSKDR